MIDRLINIEKLSAPEGDGTGVYCNREGLFIGPGIPLITIEKQDSWGKSEFRVRPFQEIDEILSFAYGTNFVSARMTGGLSAIAKALNYGDMSRAIIASLKLRLPPLPPEALSRLAKYNPDEPRDARGRWTTNGVDGQESANDTSTGDGQQEAAADPALHELCMNRCYMLLEAPKIRRDSDVNKYAFLQCKAECDRLYG